jgi:tetratricopeptide (TPR) repeat protein
VAVLVVGRALFRAHSTPVPIGADGLVVVLPVNVARSTTETTWIRLGAMDYLASRLRDDAGMKVLPSERIVALVGADSGAHVVEADELARVRRVTGATWLLAPRVAASGQEWQFAIDAYRDGKASSFLGHASTPLGAADLAATRFLEATGRSGLPTSEPPTAVRELLQRIDVAMLTGDFAVARRLVEGVPAADLVDNPALQLRSGRIAFGTGRWDAAETAFRPLAEDDPGIPASTRAQAEMGLGAVAIRRHRFENAGSHYSRAIALLGDNGDPELLGNAYMTRGVANGSLGRFDHTMADYGRARVELERTGDPIGIATLDLNTAIVDTQRGRFTASLATFDRAITVYERFDIADKLMTALAGKTDAQLALLDNSGAVASSEHAWKLAPRIEDQALLQFMGVRRVQALRASGQLTAAGQVLQRFETTETADSTDPEFGVVRAGLFVDQGKPELALRLADDILHHIERAPEATCETTTAEAVTTLVDAALRTHRVRDARQLLTRLREIRGNPPPDEDLEWALANELVAAQVQAAGNDSGAVAHFESALALAERDGRPAVMVQAGDAYARYLDAKPDHAAAASLAGRLAPYIDRDYRAARASAVLYRQLGERKLADTAYQDAVRLAGERDVHALP